MSGSPWLTFSPDGKRLASSAGIWDAQQANCSVSAQSTAAAAVRLPSAPMATASPSFLSMAPK